MKRQFTNKLHVFIVVGKLDGYIGNIKISVGYELAFHRLGLCVAGSTHVTELRRVMYRIGISKELLYKSILQGYGKLNAHVKTYV